ncbi:MAG TPA: hypothetical protein VFO42_09580 [Sphingomicrobium sp.]|nr:hypothetical protein [Sphingomicrobium sp.]
MRREMIALAFMLSALAACDKQPAAQDVRQADQELARDNLDSNDLTAIDAVSGADSNMAADIDFANMALNTDDEAESADRQPARRARAAPAERGDSDQPAAANDSQPPETDDGAN